MTGAEVFAQLCKEEELAALFCCPGNYTVINAIAAAGVPAYGGRTEGAMCAAADGFSRVTGEVTACSGTEGPGLTHMIMNIASAAAARTPLLVLASNMQLAGDDREAFIQTGYQQPITTGMKNYGKRLIAPEPRVGVRRVRVPQSEVGRAKPGASRFSRRGGPRASSPIRRSLRTITARTSIARSRRPRPPEKDVEKALDMISKAERPLLIAGQGVFQNKAWEPLLKAAEKNELAVVTSGPTRGHFPDDHRLSAALLPEAVISADLVIFVGQYCMPSPGEYRCNPDVKTIRVHPVAEDLGRNWPLDWASSAAKGRFSKRWPICCRRQTG